MALSLDIWWNNFCLIRNPRRAHLGAVPTWGRYCPSSLESVLVVGKRPAAPEVRIPKRRPHALELEPPLHRLFQRAMENPVDRTIRLMSLAAGIVGLLVIVAFQFI
jgi:hypothetical protein